MCRQNPFPSFPPPPPPTLRPSPSPNPISASLCDWLQRQCLRGILTLFNLSFPSPSILFLWQVINGKYTYLVLFCWLAVVFGFVVFESHCCAWSLLKRTFEICLSRLSVQPLCLVLNCWSKSSFVLPSPLFFFIRCVFFSSHSKYENRIREELTFL